MATIGVTDFYDKKFSELNFTGAWLDSFGTPERNFKALVYGGSGNGKTEFMVMLGKYLATFTKVYYNSHEQKHSKSLQMAVIRNNLKEVAGKIIFADGEPFDEMVSRLKKRNSPGAIILDSLQYMNLTANQYKQLVQMFPRKIIIVVSWEQANKPQGSHAEAILYMVDVKIRVKNFRAEFRSRFGGNKDFIIWDKPTQGNAKQPAKSAQSELFSTSLNAEIPTIKA